MDPRHELIEAEAKRRCVAGGYTLETPARALTSHADRSGPLWRAMIPDVEAEIERIEAAGFVVSPDPYDWDVDDEDDATLFRFSWASFCAGLCFAGLLFQFARTFG